MTDRLYNAITEAERDQSRRKANGASAPTSAEPRHTWDDPDISLLDDRRGELPEFPIEALTPACREWVEHAALGAGVTIDHVAVPLIGIVSALIGTARRAQAVPSWTEPMTLWAAIVGFSGDGKSPGLNAVKDGLDIIVKDRAGRIDELRRKHESKAEAAKAALKQWKEDVKAAVTNHTTVPIKPPTADDPGKFVAPRLYVSDATIERLGDLLTVRPQGMLLIADELAGLLLNMARYTGGQDDEFWLEAWNGKAYVVERMSRPPLRIRHLLIGVTGGLQPEKLARSFEGPADGMYAQFLFAWPARSHYRPLADTAGGTEPAIVNAVGRLADLGGDDEQDFAPHYIPLSTQAREVFEVFRQLVDKRVPTLDGREREWWAKAPGHTLRLAGVLTFLAWAMKPPEPEPKEIAADFMSAAVKLIRDYFAPHARAALRQIGLSERDVDARRALRWMRAGRHAEVNREDIRRHALGQKLNADETQVTLQRLAKAGWVRQQETTTGPKGGRPASLWAVNPLLLSMTA